MKREEFCELRDIVEKGDNFSSLDEMKLCNYKVDNAIIMAAGYSARCMPLSEVMPKGLFQIKGEALIEREIRQLKEAGINQIIVVTGYKHEMFDYLEDKYGVILIYNEYYNKYNNISSLYVAKDYLANSYILCCDNYYVDNVFHKYVYDSYYSCVYSEKFCDEFCVTGLDSQGYITGIKRGGERAWYTIGDCYFDRKFSKIFLEYLEKEWNVSDTKQLLMDDFHIKHIDELPFYMEKRNADKIYEFDTIQEMVAFDSDFVDFQAKHSVDENIINQVAIKFSGVNAYHSVPTEQKLGRLHLNENLWGPSPKCLDVLKNINLDDLYLYDLRNKDILVTALSRQTGISENNIFVHDGSAEVIKSIFTVVLDKDSCVLLPNPGWSYYESVANVKLAKCIKYNVYEDGDTYKYDLDDLLLKAKEFAPKIIVITTPHMPTGCDISNSDIERVVEENPQSLIVVDEAYWGYDRYDSEFEHDLIMSHSNVVVTRTFSKFYGLADIRIGYGLCSYPLRQTIGLDLPLFKSCGISRRIAIVAINDIEYYANMRSESLKIRDWFSKELNQLHGVKAYKSVSNFVFVKITDVDANTVRAFMEENGILVRLFTDKDSLRLRITIAPKEIMQRVIVQLRKALAL